jgi:hypothetical protein
MWTIASGVPIEALVDYLHLWAAVDGVQLSDQPDKTIWRWTVDGTYPAKSAYNMLHTGSITLPGYKLIWKTWGANADKDLPLASVQAQALDGGQEEKTWPRG